jgi:ABC-type spermidine/putrescine transport system permease subunit II
MAWWHLCVRPRFGAVIGIGLAAAALSLHEIESTVFVQPPGPTSLAQYVLDKLHYNRNEDLCAASANLFLVGLVIAGIAGWLIGRVRRSRTF